MLRRAAVLFIPLLAACASSTRQTYVPEPEPCTDPASVRLQAEHPDSLPGPEWQRLQTLDQECVAARAEAGRKTDAQAGANHHGGWWMGSGLVMALMMAAMWIP